jgi:oligopeptide transport system substrate-binding protein
MKRDSIPSAPSRRPRINAINPCWQGAIALLLLLFLATGCGSDGKRADLVILNGAEPESIDPAVVTGQLEGRICYAIFEGLLHFDRFGKPQPGIAETWDLSNDSKIYMFHLRSNAKWSNGDPVTANDFVQSWRRVLLPETASEYAYLLYHIKNAQPFNEGTLKEFGQVGIKAIDDRTFRVELEAPVPYFLDLCAFSCSTRAWVMLFTNPTVIAPASA